ncbi:hypothetical protein GGD81_004097 [Rhodobium orientis]|nr:DUF3768 domain-containing protein [Rhodobium orientis]MBB4305031.1 hypothetical protein [Rhodobium orientis]
MTAILMDKTAKVRDLNDAFRRSFVGGRVVITNGTDTLNDADKLALFDLVKGFDAFTADNDPHGEHDFGSIAFKGGRFFWKIDCYDRNLIYHSPDPADLSVTERVLTIMRAEEY